MDGFILPFCHSGEQWIQCGTVEKYDTSYFIRSNNRKTRGKVLSRHLKSRLPLSIHWFLAVYQLFIWTYRTTQFIATSPALCSYYSGLFVLFKQIFGCCCNGSNIEKGKIFIHSTWNTLARSLAGSYPRILTLQLLLRIGHLEIHTFCITFQRNVRFVSLFHSHNVNGMIHTAFCCWDVCRVSRSTKVQLQSMICYWFSLFVFSPFPWFATHPRLFVEFVDKYGIFFSSSHSSTAIL